MRLHRVLAVAALVVSLVSVDLVAAAPANAVSNLTLCSTYEGCKALGMTAHGYETRHGKSYWRMVGGHNCTNYAAFLMIKAGMSRTRPWKGNGNATGWGYSGNPRNKTPARGAIAWWAANKDGAGASGHVAYVEAVLSPGLIVISEDNYGGEFYWRVIRSTDPGWPTGFIHFADSGAANNVPAYRASPTTQGLYADASMRKKLDPRYLKPGSSAWVSMSVQNTGSATWSGVQLSTDTPLGRASRLASGWSVPSLAATQKQAGVAIGQSATFGFWITIPATAVTGTRFTERFTPIGPSGPIPHGSSTLTVTADTRDLFTSTPAVRLTGSARQGQTLTADPGAYAPAADAVTYQWSRGGVAIPGATRQSYVLKDADVGRVVSVAVTATKRNYVPVIQSATSATVRSIHSNTLTLRHSLKVGDQIVSGNGQYRAVQTASGKFVVQNRFTKKVVYRASKVKSVRTKLRSDGVLLSYSSHGKVVWKSSAKATKAKRAVVTNSGKLVLDSASGKHLWNSAKVRK